ncbi:MAG: peptidoglycan-binding protein [Hyphomicrobiaceae bacterium]
MSLTPFQARIALSTFLLATSSIAINLLVLQPDAKGGSQYSDPANYAMDAERLRRLATEAASGADPGTPRAPSILNAPRAQEPPPPPSRNPVTAGRFAPSSAAFVETTVPDVDATVSSTAIATSIQRELDKRGYKPGAIDGAVGLRTRAAIMAYETDNGLPLTAEASPELLAHLRFGSSAPGNAVGLDGMIKPPSGDAERVTHTIQQSLHQLGYLPASVSPANDESTTRAIREFEMDSGMIPTGRISAALVAELARRLNRKSAI